MTILIARELDSAGRVALLAREVARNEFDIGSDGIFLGYEHALPVGKHAQTGDALCWGDRPTMGGTYIYSSEVREALEGEQRDAVRLPCELIPAGKMRMGAPRWWCRTHQTHWGVKSDILRAVKSRKLACANAERLVSYAQHLHPVHLSGDDEVAISCLLPPALTHGGAPSPERPRIEVRGSQARQPAPLSSLGRHAILVSFSRGDDLFAEKETVAVTPPAAYEFVRALDDGRSLSCVVCRDCGFPHLDVGAFHSRPHSKHLCSNCGRDNTWSDGPIASTPLIYLHRLSIHTAQPLPVQTVLNLDEYPEARFSVWASLPSIIWRLREPEMRGIRVRLELCSGHIVDEVFGTVIYRGRPLEREELLQMMISHTIV